MRNEFGVEHPLSHILQAGSAILFLAMWSLDSFIFRFSIRLAEFVPLFIRLILAGSSLAAAFLLLSLSHQKVCGKRTDPYTVVKTGAYGRVRHPMYLGILLIYLGFVLSTLSWISFALWVGIFIIYDYLASYEEKNLIRIFGKAYVDYQKRVPKWIPRIFR